MASKSEKERGRWAPQRTREAVLRLLRGEDLEASRAPSVLPNGSFAAQALDTGWHP